MTRPAAEGKWNEALINARACIARELLSSHAVSAMLGAVALHPHQQTAVARLRTLLRLTNGALLADGTGLGKTFVALAVAAEVGHTLVIAPASLLDSWQRAMAQTGVQLPLLSMERLSRSGWRAPCDLQLVIVDESHHFRNPRTRRYEAAAAICDRAKVLLLSATPLQNRREDLVAQLALFLGQGAGALGDDEVARFIVRRRGEDIALRLPSLDGPHRIELAVTNDLLDELTAIPPPLPGSDEGEAGALVTYTLLRQWASSQAALVGWLRRRLAKAVALATSLEAGRWPSHNDLAAWTCAEDSVQLALPELLTPLGVHSPPIGAMLESVRAHMEGLRRVLAVVDRRIDPDPYRAEALDAVCRAHRPARVIAFSQFAETVRALSRLLIGQRPGVAELTAGGARVAGGRISRRAVLAQFAPRSPETGEPPLAEQISLLVTTDVLSEGLDLHTASVVIHLDLPWNPARLAQRVGRVRRLGAAHDVVSVYWIAPPTSAERVLRVEARLKAKLGIASQVVGSDTPVALGAEHSHDTARPELESETLALVSRWRRDTCQRPVSTSPLCAAAVRAPESGVLALIRDGDHRILVGSVAGGELTADPVVVARVVHLCAADAPLRVDDALLARALRRVESWCEGRSAHERLALIGPAGSRVRARITARIAELLASAPRHRRTAIATEASRARRALVVPLGAGAERRLAALADSREPNASWLSEIAALAEGRSTTATGVAAPLPLVVILLGGAPSPVSELALPGA